ncbi:MAG: site-2 protease family protein [Calditrichaeota bacterium]|nr:site-2 protease family protein [Calditrichota bacterium]
MNFTQIILFLPPILIALTFHEYAHGMMAYRLGDPTAKRAGRLTLNPLSHLDPIGTLALLLVHFGWAKPVPVNPAYLSNPRRDMIWISLAGPGANIVLAFILGVIQQFLIGQGIISHHSIPHIMLSFTVFINLMLAFFNLMPLPPLDGSKVVGGLIPMQYLRMCETFERFGGFIIIALFLLGSMTGISIFKPIFKLSAIVYTAFTGEQSLF